MYSASLPSIALRVTDRPVGTGGATNGGRRDGEVAEDPQASDTANAPLTHTNEIVRASGGRPT
jgi:hypothetical protein